MRTVVQKGKLADTPEGVKEKRFHDTIRKWFKLEELHGPEILKLISHYKNGAQMYLNLTFPGVNATFHQYLICIQMR